MESERELLKGVLEQMDRLATVSRQVNARVVVLEAVLIELLRVLAEAQPAGGPIQLAVQRAHDRVRQQMELSPEPHPAVDKTALSALSDVLAAAGLPRS